MIGFSSAATSSKRSMTMRQSRKCLDSLESRRPLNTIYQANGLARATGQILLSPKQMARVDRASIDLGILGIDLMEAAGSAVANAVQRRWSRRSVLVLCGLGNNGGDGFVAARYLSDAGWPVQLALLGPTSQLIGDAAHHAGLWTGPIEKFDPTLLDQADLIIDAIFGAGLSRSTDGLAREMIEAMIQKSSVICAVDVPSGLDGATGLVRGAAAPAALTVTFFRKKPGHLLYPGRALCGTVEVADIGIPNAVFDGPEAQTWQTWENAPALWQDAFAWPQPQGHKYQRGHALILGGATTTGASRLVARAAQRVGAGLVTLAAPQIAWAIYAASLTGVMVHPLRDLTRAQGDDDFALLLADQRRNAIAIGPGAGVNENTRAAVFAALSTRKSVVLDADALTVFASDPASLFAAIQGPCVMTPHEGEFARLFKSAGNAAAADKLTRARDAADQSGAIILLKGSDTVIAQPGGPAVINANAPATLATGGSGDVLAGFIVGLLAQGLDPFRAACAACWLHSEAATTFGPGLIAEDIPDALPAVLRKLMQP